MYKIAISDLDGTLLGPDHRISTTSIAGVKQWINKGKTFAIATGRHFIEAKNIQQQIDAPMSIISSNGARVHNEQDELIYQQNLPAEIAQYISDEFADGQVQVNLFTDQLWLCNFALEELKNYRLGEGFECRSVNLKTLDKSAIIKAFFWGDRPQLELIHDKIYKKYGNRVNLTFSLNRCLEVMEANTNKGSAIQALIKTEQIEVNECIAFGDAMNDLEMLEYVGRPIMMENAQQELKNALPNTESALTSKEHGVVNKLQEILMTENTR